MNRLLLGLLALLLLVLPATAQDLTRGGRYYATPPTLTDQAWAPLTLDVNGRAAPVCNLSAAVTVAAAATTQIVGLTAGQTIYVCSFVLSGDTLATTTKFVYGTGTNCGTGQANITASMRLPDEGSIAISAGGVMLFNALVANALCVNAATGAVTGFITYGKF